MDDDRPMLAAFTDLAPAAQLEHLTQQHGRRLTANQRANIAPRKRVHDQDHREIPDHILDHVHA